MGLSTTTWFIIGHSLGGTVATNYAENNPDQVAGMVLLGSWIADLGGEGTTTLSWSKSTHPGFLSNQSIQK